MKLVFAIVLSMIATLVHAAQKADAKLDYDAAWVYSLTVTDSTGDEYFTLSLLKDNTLSYDYWRDAEQAGDKVVNLTADQVKMLTDKYAAAFSAMAKVADPKAGASYALEKIDGRKSTTYTTGSDAAIKALLDAIKPLLGKDYPIKIN